MIRFIKNTESGMPKQHPVGMTHCGESKLNINQALFDSPADWISPNWKLSRGNAVIQLLAPRLGIIPRQRTAKKLLSRIRIIYGGTGEIINGYGNVFFAD
jgi:hypothetical protein